MSLGGARKLQADIARENMTAHAGQAPAPALGWECQRCGAANDAAEEFCAKCGADGQSAKKIPQLPEPDSIPVFIVTMNEVPGHRVTEIHGDVFGIVVLARSYFSNLGAQLTAIAGGEITGYTKLLTDSRNLARQRLWREACARGANAVVAMRFDCNEIAGIMSEVVAYGTAVTVVPGPAVPVEIRRAEPIEGREF